jgi:2-isopropylmalate synthase
MKEHLVIFDTTLRDGEQSPGASMTKEEKLRVARQLERMQVDVIEAGFAAASPGDFDAISRLPRSSRVHRLLAGTFQRERHSSRRRGDRRRHEGRIHTFIATSPIHMEKKLRMTPDQVVEAAVRRCIGRANTPTMSSFRPKTRCAPTSTFCAVSSPR